MEADLRGSVSRGSEILHSARPPPLASASRSELQEENSGVGLSLLFILSSLFLQILTAFRGLWGSIWVTFL